MSSLRRRDEKWEAQCQASEARSKWRAPQPPSARAAADLLHGATEDLTPRLSKLYTGVVHDVMRGMGLKDFTLPHTLHPVTVARTIAGPVFTVRGKVTPKAEPHDTLLAWTGFLSKAKSGHIVVIAANDDEVAHMGELSGETLMRKGVPGVVVDGGCARRRIPDGDGLCGLCALRDAARHRRLLDGRRDGRADQDRQGRRSRRTTICSPTATASSCCRARAPPRSYRRPRVAVGTESQIRTAILGGMDPQEAYLKFGKF